MKVKHHKKQGQANDQDKNTYTQTTQQAINSFLEDANDSENDDTSLDNDSSFPEPSLSEIAREAATYAQPFEQIDMDDVLNSRLYALKSNPRTEMLISSNTGKESSKFKQKAFQFEKLAAQAYTTTMDRFAASYHALTQQQGQHLFENLFTNVFYLYDSMRIIKNKKAARYKKILDAVRNGRINNQNFRIIASRLARTVRNTDIDEYISFANDYDLPRICTYNRDVDSFNRKYVEHSSKPTLKMVCQGDKAAKPKFAGNLKACMEFVIGMRVMFTQNLSVQLGITNGALGTLLYVVFAPGIHPPNLPEYVIVQLDKYTGPSCFEDIPKCVVITPHANRILNASRRRRRQYPFVPAAAISIHKSEGKTFHGKYVIDFGNANRYSKFSPSLTDGLEYTALSRGTELTNILIDGGGNFTQLRDRFKRIKAGVNFFARQEETIRLRKLAVKTEINSAALSYEDFCHNDFLPIPSDIQDSVVTNDRQQNMLSLQQKDTVMSPSSQQSVSSQTSQQQSQLSQVSQSSSMHSTQIDNIEDFEAKKKQGPGVFGIIQNIHSIEFKKILAKYNQTQEILLYAAHESYAFYKKEAIKRGLIYQKPFQPQLRTIVDVDFEEGAVPVETNWGKVKPQHEKNPIQLEMDRNEELHRKSKFIPQQYRPPETTEQKQEIEFYQNAPYHGYDEYNEYCESETPIADKIDERDEFEDLLHDSGLKNVLEAHSADDNLAFGFQKPGEGPFEPEDAPTFDDLATAGGMNTLLKRLTPKLRKKLRKESQKLYQAHATQVETIKTIIENPEEMNSIIDELKKQFAKDVNKIKLFYVQQHVLNDIEQQRLSNVRKDKKDKEQTIPSTSSAPTTPTVPSKPLAAPTTPMDKLPLTSPKPAPSSEQQKKSIILPECFEFKEIWDTVHPINSNQNVHNKHDRRLVRMGYYLRPRLGKPNQLVKRPAFGAFGLFDQNSRVQTFMRQYEASLRQLQTLFKALNTPKYLVTFDTIASRPSSCINNGTNMCWLNASIQLLCTMEEDLNHALNEILDPIREYYLLNRRYITQKKNIENDLYMLMQQALCEMSYTDIKVHTPIAGLVINKIFPVLRGNGEQNDAFEFLVHLIEETALGARIQQMFQYFKLPVVRCPKNHLIHKNPEACTALVLNFPFNAKETIQQLDNTSHYVDMHNTADSINRKFHNKGYLTVQDLIFIEFDAEYQQTNPRTFTNAFCAACYETKIYNAKHNTNYETLPDNMLSNINYVDNKYHDIVSDPANKVRKTTEMTVINNEQMKYLLIEVNRFQPIVVANRQQQQQLTHKKTNPKKVAYAGPQYRKNYTQLHPNEVITFNKQLFSLKSVVYHLGGFATPNGGHYVAECKRTIPSEDHDKQYAIFRCNDQTIEQKKKLQFKPHSKDSYILLYKKDEPVINKPREKKRVTFLEEKNEIKVITDETNTESSFSSTSSETRLLMSGLVNFKAKVADSTSLSQNKKDVEMHLTQEKQTNKDASVEEIEEIESSSTYTDSSSKEDDDVIEMTPIESETKEKDEAIIQTSKSEYKISSFRHHDMTYWKQLQPTQLILGIIKTLNYADHFCQHPRPVCDCGQKHIAPCLYCNKYFPNEFRILPIPTGKKRKRERDLKENQTQSFRAANASESKEPDISYTKPPPTKKRRT